MKKQRMTIEELRELSPSMDNPVELVCDDGHYDFYRKKLTVILCYKNQFVSIDGDDDIYFLESYELHHYPSLKPEPRFEEVTLWQHSCFAYLVDSDNNFINVGTNNRYPGFDTKESVRILARLKMNSDTFEIVGIWEDEE